MSRAVRISGKELRDLRRKRYQRATYDLVDTPTAGVRLVLPPHHASLNDWTSWDIHRQGREKAEWDKRIAALVPYPRVIPCGVRIVATSFFDDKLRHDPDNYVPKMILDSMLGRILRDDSGADVGELVLRVRRSERNARTEILVEPFEWDVYGA